MKYLAVRHSTTASDRFGKNHIDILHKLKWYNHNANNKYMVNIKQSTLTIKIFCSKTYPKLRSEQTPKS